MSQVLAPKDQWFVVHVLSGQENKVRDNIEKRVKTEEMSDVIFEVLVPTERVSEIKRGKKSETTRKFFPGYLIINMHLLDENNQLRLSPEEQAEFDDLRREVGGDAEYLRMCWRERLRAARRVFNDPEQVEQIVHILEAADGQT